MLDVGTGSGVLSIASSLLGAKEIFAYDLDDVAVRVAQENIELNPGMENIHVAAGDLLKGVEIEADVIVANILADILIHLTEDAYRLVKDEGYLIMSGIIKGKWDMVRQSAESAGFFLETHMVQGEWNACVFKKPRIFRCDWRLACNSILSKAVLSPVTIEDKETSKHMFQVMRLKEDDEVILVFDDGIKRLARVLNVEARQFELVQELADNVELPVQVTIASGFPKGDKLEFITQK